MSGSQVRKVAVLGAGLMGHGIAQVCAQIAGYEVSLLDVKQEFVDRGVAMIKDSLARFVAKGTIDTKAVPATMVRMAGSAAESRTRPLAAIAARNGIK